MTKEYQGVVAELRGKYCGGGMEGWAGRVAHKAQAADIEGHLGKAERWSGLVERSNRSGRRPGEYEEWRQSRGLEPEGS